MSKQVHIFRASGNPSNAATRYISPINGQYFSATEHEGTCICTADGTFSNWSIGLPTDPGGTGSLTFTLRVNGVDSAASITISAGSQAGTWVGTPISLLEDDELSISCVPANTPALSTPWMSWDFDGDTAGACIYGSGNVNGSVAITRTNRLLNCVDITNWTSANARSVCGINGTIDRYTVKLDADPGGGSWVTRINKNGIAQDGTGGTPNTQMTFGPGTTKQSATFSLSVSAGDHLSLTMDDSGGATTKPIFGVRLISSVPGICHFGGCTAANFDTTNTQYHRTCQGDDLGGGTEGNREVTVGLTAFSLTNMWVVINDIPGTGDAYLFSLRKNNADASNSVNIANSNTSGSNASSTGYVTGDTLTLEVNPDATPNARAGGWAWGMLAVEAAEEIQRVTQLVVQVIYDEDATDNPPDDVTECTGGGTVATGTNPAAGTSLATTTAPICWMELTLNDGSPATVYRWAAGGVNIGEPKQARVLEFGKVTRALSDPDGGPEAATISTLLADVDGTVRALWVSGTLRHAAVEYYISDLATLQASGAPWRVFRGFVSECQPEGDRRFRLISEDVLTARLNSIDAQDLQTPRLLVDETIADLDPAEPMFGRAVPDIYGSISNQTGAWQLEYVGSAVVTGQEGLGKLHWFLVGAGVLGVQEVFVGGLGATPVSRIQLTEVSFGGPWYCPGKAGWIEANDWSIRVGRRYTLIAGSPGAPSVRLAKEGTIPALVNVCGYDTVGDRLTSPVETINGPARALLHWLNNRVAQDATGNWLDIAEHGAFSLFDTTTFEDVQALFDAASPVLTCDGAVGGDYQQASWRDRVAEFCRSFAYDFGTNRHGQGILVKLDRTDPASSATEFGPEKILASSVSVDLRASACENEVRYVFRRNYVTTLPFLTPNTNSRLPKDPYKGEWESGLQTLQDTASITALGGGTTGLRRSQVQELTLVRDEATALATATERLDLFSPPNGRCEGSFDLTLKHGAAVELGAVITAEHWDLPWTGSRRCQVRRHQTDLDALIVTVGFRDVDDLLP